MVLASLAGRGILATVANLVKDGSESLERGKPVQM